jgi:hypothetical protein
MLFVQREVIRRSASVYLADTSPPSIESFEPDQHWRWCDPDELCIWNDCAEDYADTNPEAHFVLKPIQDGLDEALAFFSRDFGSFTPCFRKANSNGLLSAFDLLAAAAA